ncbi:hypothetical protein ACQKIE_15205 [Luteibacter sp. NPDC031894]|uniref:hypothetical protein n=1 Tax=Luteibacter sp. NPDC031894 TaxID=3390572 RepID=UPI003CFFCA56
MRDTVELLEAIGRDSSLRRASRDELAKALEAAEASPGLREFAVRGDGTTLARELGLKQMHVEHQSQTGAHEDEEHDHDHDREDNEGDDEDAPKERSGDTDDSLPG